MKLSNFVKVAVAGVLLMSVAVAYAQGGGGGGGRGQGRGGGFGQRGGMFGGPAQLANRADVQRDLGVSAEQKSKIDALQQQLREERQQMMQDMFSGGERPDPAEMQKVMEKANDKAKAELAKILDEKQMKRLDEIQVQLAGPSALLLPAVQKALGMTSDQVNKARDLQQKQQQANMAVFEKVRNQEISREEAQAANQKNTQVLNDELLKILMKEQGDKFKEMGGKPFKADPPQDRGGGGI